jgi:thiol:disulfide interchange protein
LVADTVPLRALWSASGVPPQEEIRGNLRWFRDFARVQEHARREHKPLCVDFYAMWRANCKAFDHLTRRDARLNTALQQVVLVKIYDIDAGFRTFQREPQFPELGGGGGSRSKVASG